MSGPKVPQPMIVLADGRKSLVPNDPVTALEFMFEAYDAMHQRKLSLETNLENTALKLEEVWDMYYQAVNDAEEVDEELEEARDEIDRLETELAARPPLHE